MDLLTAIGRQLGSAVRSAAVRRGSTGTGRAQTRAEQQLRESTAQLEAANKELEAFRIPSPTTCVPRCGPSTASRASCSMSMPLAGAGGTALPAPGSGQHPTDGASGGRPAGLLAPEPPTDGQAARRSGGPGAARFRTCTPTRGAERRSTWSSGTCPACQADPALLKQVWVNLLSNALKFTVDERGR